MRRVLTILFISVFIISAFSPVYAEAPRSAFYVMHKGSGTTLTSENEDALLPVSGLSRIAPLLIITEAIDNGGFSLDTDITVSKKASQIHGSTAFLDANEVISAEGLYKSAAMIGAGDAIYALAEGIYGSAEKFTESMNSRLKALGADVIYTDITGDGSELSARNIAKIAAALSDHEIYLKYSSIYMDKIVHTGGRETELVNQNRLIRTMQGCRGLFTGSSKAAGYCGAFYIERNGCELICVTLGEESSASRFDHVRNEIEAVFSSYHENKLAQKGDTVIAQYPVTGSTVGTCELVAASDASVLTEQGQKLTTAYNLPDSLTAPIHAGDCVGNAVYSDESGNVLASVELTVNADIEKAGFFDFFRLTALCLTGGM